MPECFYCNRYIAPDANHCPNCGSTDPNSPSSSSSDDAEGAAIVWISGISGIIGFFIGGYEGWGVGGVGGSLILSVLYAIGGAILAGVVMAAARLGLIIGAVMLAFWILKQLWGLGK